MMKKDDNMFSLLGAPLSSDAVQKLLSDIGADPKVKIKKGDTEAYVVNHELGIELLFEDERSVTNSWLEYMEGDLVLTNIRVYTKKTSDINAYSQGLPFNIRPEMTRADVIELLGPPSFSNERLGTNRWDFEKGSVAVAFSSADGSMEDVSVLIWS